MSPLQHCRDSVQTRSRHRCLRARELAALDTRIPLVESASPAARVALEDVAIGAGGIDRLVAAEQTGNSVTATVGGVAGLLI